MQLSSQQLAELLIGIAHAQAATVKGMKPATPSDALSALPVRILETVLKGAPVQAADVAKELERLARRSEPTGGPGADLDFGAPPP